MERESLGALLDVAAVAAYDKSSLAEYVDWLFAERDKLRDAIEEASKRRAAAQQLTGASGSSPRHDQEQALPAWAAYASSDEAASGSISARAGAS